MSGSLAAPHGRAIAAASDASSLDASLARAKAARARVVERTSNAEIVAAICATARTWREQADPRRRSTIAELARSLSMSEAMLDRGLDDLFASIDERAMADLLAEADNPDALERAVDGRRLLGPPAVFHLLAGNVPGLAIPAIVASMLSRSICIVRDSERQPALTCAFVSSLAEHAPDLGAMIVPVAWRAGDDGQRALERAVARAVSRVELYGTDATLGRLAPRFAETAAEVVERGARLSVGLVAASLDADSTILDRWASGFADDVVMYEGKGCLTPHAIVVEGDAACALAFAERLGAALDRVERRWPRYRQSLAEETARRAFIDSSEVSSLASGKRVLRGAGDAWCLHAAPAAAPAAGPSLGPGLRCATVVAAPDRDHVLKWLARAQTPLAGVGLATDPKAGARSGARVGPAAAGTPSRAQLERALRDLGATLVCEPGRMQAPPLTWQQDGRRRLGDLLAWTQTP
jgi:hypothetical protein